jgi:hypothetical protein
MAAAKEMGPGVKTAGMAIQTLVRFAAPGLPVRFWCFAAPAGFAFVFNRADDLAAVFCALLSPAGGQA